MDEFEQFKQREADYTKEFENRAKEYVCHLDKTHDDISKMPLGLSNSRKNQYTTGYLKIIDSARESLKTFFDEDNLRKDYPQTFKNMREKYHRMYLGLGKIESTDFYDGEYRAARDLYKGLDYVIQSTAAFDLTQLLRHKHQREAGKGETAIRVT